MVGGGARSVLRFGRSPLLWLWLACCLPQAAAQPPAPRVLAADAVLKGSQASELRWPVAVAAASTIEIAVADAYRSRLVIFFSADGWTGARAIALPGSPLDVVYAGDRYLVALRGRRALAAVARPDFELDSLALPEGTVPGFLAAAAGGGLLVWDAAGERVLNLDEDGGIRREKALPGGVTALAAEPGGGFYAAFAGEAEVRRYGAGGQLLATWTVPGVDPVRAWPSGLAAEPGGRLLIADRHAGRIVALDVAGHLVGVGSQRGWHAGRLSSPAGLARLADGRVAVADQGNGRVQIFRPIAGGSP